MKELWPRQIRTDIRMLACMHIRSHIHLSKIVTVSRFTASGLDKKEQYSCLYSRANPKVWLHLYSIHVVGCNNIQSVILLVNIIVMSSNTSITSTFMIILLHQTELEVWQKTRESILKHSIEAILPLIIY